MDGSRGHLSRRLGHDLTAISELRTKPDLLAPGVFFTAAECARIERSAEPAASSAGLFAAKEALFKALRLPAGSFWTDIEVTHDPHGAPVFRFHGHAADFLREHGLVAHLSISHSGDYASAVVLIEACT